MVSCPSVDSFSFHFLETDPEFNSKSTTDQDFPVSGLSFSGQHQVEIYNANNAMDKANKRPWGSKNVFGFPKHLFRMQVQSVWDTLNAELKWIDLFSQANQPIEYVYIAFVTL